MVATIHQIFSSGVLVSNLTVQVLSCTETASVESWGSLIHLLRGAATLIPVINSLDAYNIVYAVENQSKIGTLDLLVYESPAYVV